MRNSLMAFGFGLALPLGAAVSFASVVSLFVSAPAAEANLRAVGNASSMNVLQMHIDYPKVVPVQDVNDPI